MVLILITLFWILEFQSKWDVAQWGALVPLEVNLSTSTTSASTLEASDELLWGGGDESFLWGYADLIFIHSVPAEHLSFDPPRLPSCPS